jgi:alpha-D-xyloside xylohydrolase
VPMGPEIQYTGEKPADPLTLYIFEGKDGRFTLYEDDGTTYGYEKGLFATIEFTWDNANRKLSVGKLQGDFPGLVRDRTLLVKLITKGGAGGIDFGGIPVRTLVYSGEAVELEL